MFLIYDEVKANAKMATHSGTGEVVLAPVQPEFRPLKVTPHPQQARIDEFKRIPSLVR